MAAGAQNILPEYILKPFISKEIKAFFPHTPLKMPI
jgi:hypothetical protein